MRFESPEELGRFLYDRAVEPGHTGADRLRLAVASGMAAARLWREYAGEP